MKKLRKITDTPRQAALKLKIGYTNQEKTAISKARAFNKKRGLK